MTTTASTRRVPIVAYGTPEQKERLALLRTAHGARSDSEMVGRLIDGVRSGGPGASLSADELLTHALRAEFGWPGAEESAALLRTVQEVGTGDTGGLLPVNVVADFVTFVDASRPAISASGPRGDMPEKGKTFTRPKVTQFPSSGAQTEKAQLTSQQLLSSATTLTKTTHGDVLLVTEQDIDWSADGFLVGLTEALALAYAIDTEATFAAAIAAAVSTNTVDGGALDFASIVEGVAAAQLALIGTAGVPGDLLYVGATGLATLTAATGTLAVPQLFPSVVYSPGFDDDFVAVAVSRLMEVFELQKGMTLTTPVRSVHAGTVDEVRVPSTLERSLSYRGYLATNVYAEGICGLVAS